MLECNLLHLAAATQNELGQQARGVALTGAACTAADRLLVSRSSSWTSVCGSGAGDAARLEEAEVQMHGSSSVSAPSGDGTSGTFAESLG